MKLNEVSTWYGRSIDELSREGLIEVINHLGRENLNLEKDRRRWFEAADPLKYLMGKPVG